MSDLSQISKAIFHTLFHEYSQLPWYKRFFFPRELERALVIFYIDKNTESAVSVCDAFFNHTWFFQHWFFSCLLRFSNAPLIQTLALLRQDSLTPDEIQANLKEELEREDYNENSSLNNIPEESSAKIKNNQESTEQAASIAATNTLKMLQEIGLLEGSKAESNRTAVITHEDLKNLEIAMRQLQKAGLLNDDRKQANFDILLKQKSLSLFIFALTNLQSADLLDGEGAQANLDAIGMHDRPELMAYALVNLHIKELLNGDEGQANRDALVGHKRPMELAYALIKLQRDNLLNHANRNAVKSHKNLDNMLLGLQKLHWSGLLEGGFLVDSNEVQANRDAIIGGEEPYEIAASLAVLRTMGLLNAANRDAVKGHKNPHEVILSLKKLHDAGLLEGNGAQANRDAVGKDTHPQLICANLIILQTAGLLEGEGAQANRNALKGCTNSHIAEALISLYEAGLLEGDGAQANRDLVAKSSNPFEMVSGLRRLNEAGLLVGNRAQANREILKQFEDPMNGVAALIRLHALNLLTGDRAQANIEAIVQQPGNVTAICQVLFLLQEAYANVEVLPEVMQTHFDNLITHSAILFGNRVGHLWADIAPSQFTATDFLHIMGIAFLHMEDIEQGQEVIVRYIDEDLGPQDESSDEEEDDEEDDEFNAPQSTHTASINRSVSESAISLKRSYQKKLDDAGLEKVIKELSEWAHFNLYSALGLKEKAALRGLKRITAIEYTHTDAVSKVSIRQLLGLIWLAINDKDKLLGTPENTKKQFIEGLYEIQRGYNINAQGIDDGKRDLPICVAGTFNKLIEKLAAFHPDASLEYITTGQAANKFPILVKEKAKIYLTKLYQENSISEELLHKLEVLEGVGAIWKHISVPLVDEFLDEFGSLYHRGSEDFEAFLEEGKGILLEKQLLDEFRKPRVLAVVTPSVSFFQEAPSVSSPAEKADANCNL